MGKLCYFEVIQLKDDNTCGLTSYIANLRLNYLRYCDKHECPIWQIYNSLRPTVTEEEQT